MCTVLAFGVPFEAIAKNIFGETLDVFRIVDHPSKMRGGRVAMNMPTFY